MIAFNPSHALLFNEPEYPPFLVQTTLPLAQALAEKRIDEKSRFLLASFENTVIALPILAMVYHHVAQGKIGDLHWVASFCALCNAGSVFNASIDGQVYHFATQGYYDAMSLLADQESQSYWNHLTGKAVYGKLLGKRLQQLGTLLEMRAAEILNAYPNAQLALNSLSPQSTQEIAEWDAAERLSPKPTWDEDKDLLNSLSVEDTRLPRHEMGLGIWTESCQRYYPMRQIYRQHNLILDEFEGRKLLVYVDPQVGLPMAIYCEASSAEWHGDVIHLSGNQELRKALLYRNGQPSVPERPKQNAIRWHGFSALFPNCEIYG